MKNRIKIGAVGLAAAVMLAGCSQAPEGYVTEPAPPAAVEPVETTAPAETRYQFGDIVWTLEQWPDGTFHTCRQAVVAQEGDTIMATDALSDTSAGLRKCLPEYLESGNADVWTIPAAECFPSEEEALAEIARRTADAFEEYWGCE